MHTSRGSAEGRGRTERPQKQGRVVKAGLLCSAGVGDILHFAAGETEAGEGKASRAGSSRMNSFFALS